MIHIHSIRKPPHRHDTQAIHRRSTEAKARMTELLRQEVDTGKAWKRRMGCSAREMMAVLRAKP